MIELREWFRRYRERARPWLILGKGPTFERRNEFDLTSYNVISLNHVVNEIRVNVAHIIDIDVVGDCSESLARNCDWLLMPRHPHVRSARSSRALEDWFDEYPVLRDLDSQGRLVWYNLVTSQPVGDSPVIAAGDFSSEAVLDILGRMGIKTVRSLGIDGGRSYARTFEDLESTTLLSNNAPAFNLQFERLALLTEEYGIDYRPLVEPLRVFIGADKTQMVAARVLEYSLRKSASVPVDVFPMRDLGHRLPRATANQPRTEFSFYRFMIPELCGYRGRALYLDADMLVFGDLAELASLDFGDAKVLCSASKATDRWVGHDSIDNFGARMSVMLLDCGRLPWKIDDIVAGLDEGRYSYRELLDELCIVDRHDVVEAIPAEWNDLEHYDPATTKLVHFTVVPTQPWKTDDNPLAGLWMSWYREAVSVGAVPPTEVELQVADGSARAELRAALRAAPSRQAVLTNAALEYETTQRQMQQRIEALEARVGAMKRSASWRIGSAIVRAVRWPLRFASRSSRRGGRDI